MNRDRSLLRAVLQPIVISVGLALLIRATLFQVYSIPSGSMEPTLEVGDHILVTPYRAPFRDRAPSRGHVIVFRSPSQEGEFLVKRVIGIPGDVVASFEGRVGVDGHTLSEPYLVRGGGKTEHLHSSLVPGGSYLVLGDHREDSVDSRDWGFVSQSLIVGRARAVVWSSDEVRTSPSAKASTAHLAATALPHAVRWQRLFTLIR